jgi:hypothetical protein
VPSQFGEQLYEGHGRDARASGGHVVERGTHDQLIAKEGRYFELYTYQAKI